jgi:hypothetical protein
MPFPPKKKEGEGDSAGLRSYFRHRIAFTKRTAPQHTSYLSDLMARAPLGLVLVIIILSSSNANRCSYRHTVLILKTAGGV